LEPKVPDSYYAQHLAAINTRNKVIASDDITNDMGALVMPAGAELTPELATRIAHHKLAKPIEFSVALEKSINAQILQLHLQNMPIHPEVIQLIERRIEVDTFIRESSKLVSYPMILQKLTVLQMQYPDIYKDSVMGAYVALLICSELNLAPTSVHGVFLGAITRDLGYLHIDPELVASDAMVTNDQWRLLQGHVAIGYEFLNAVPGLPALVKRAVLEHHERTDGFGYPRGLMSDELCTEGQLVAFADMTIALFNRYIFGADYTVNALEPVLQLNANVHTRQITQAALRALDKVFPHIEKSRHSSADMSLMVPKLLKRQSYVKNWFEIAKETSLILKEMLGTEKFKKLDEFFSNIQTILATSGIIDDNFVDWLRGTQNKALSETEIKDIEYFALMLNEVAWQFNHSFQQISAVVGEFRESLNEEMLASAENRIHLLSELLGRFRTDVI